MTVGEMMLSRLGGQADYADRVRLGPIILIVRDIDETNHVSSIGISMEAVEPQHTLPIFLNIHEIAERMRNKFQGRDLSADSRLASAAPPCMFAPVSTSVRI